MNIQPVDLSRIKGLHCLSPEHKPAYRSLLAAYKETCRKENNPYIKFLATLPRELVMQQLVADMTNAASDPALTDEERWERVRFITSLIKMIVFAAQ